MIEVGELKIGDRVENQWFGTGTVINIEYNRSIDDEFEKVFIQFDKNTNPVELFVPTDCLGKIDKLLKNGRGEEKEMNAEFIGMKMNYNDIKDSKTNKYKVIFNNPAVILFVNEVDPYRQRKYVSKAHNEPFDPEKGLLMCLAKANGISHLDLKRILKNAKDQKKTETKNAGVKVQSIIIETGLKKQDDKEVNGEVMVNTPTNAKCFKKAKSPKGKHRGKSYRFRIGDIVVVRDCYSYKQENREDVEPMLNKEFEISDFYVDKTGTIYYIIEFDKMNLLFSGSELKPIWED